jgi:chemotaxis protein histidine kinase CheA
MGLKHPGLAGAAILGDGRVGLILDVNALVHLQAAAHLKAA